MVGVCHSHGVSSACVQANAETFFEAGSGPDNLAEMAMATQQADARPSVRPAAVRAVSAMPLEGQCGTYTASGERARGVLEQPARAVMQQSAADDNMEALRMLEASFATLPDHPETDRAKQPCDPQS